MVSVNLMIPKAHGAISQKQLTLQNIWTYEF